MSYLDRYFAGSKTNADTLKHLREQRDNAMMGIHPQGLRLSTLVQAIAVHHSLHKDKDPQLDGINGVIHQQMFLDDADRVLMELDSRAANTGGHS